MIDSGGCVYDEKLAAFYDSWFGDQSTTLDTVERLAELAGDGPVLELGIGTGRVALPLARRGIAVHGIDASPAMVEQLRTKAGGKSIPVAIGDFSEVEIGGEFSLIYAATGTFFELPTQHAQLRCFANVARHLRPGGVFVFDALLPDMHAQRGVEILQGHGADVVRLRQWDSGAQRLVSLYLVCTDEGVRCMRVSFRYAWPGELDLMAQLAGLRLRERYRNWRGEPFTASSRTHVSVYERPA
jgi:SAM-dependent methyltransferase